MNYLFGELNGQQMVFLPRHGRGHIIPPSDDKLSGQILMLSRESGVTEILSVSAVGSH